MNDSTTDPFGGLDKLLLKETKPTAAPPPPPPAPAGGATLKEASILSSKQTSIQESKVASKLISNEANQKENKQASLQERLRAVLGASDLKQNTFRYTQEELAGIRDVVYELETRYDRKVNKNDIVRIALNWLLYDFEENKQESLLVSILTSK